jgi:hypothetical protein
MTHSARSALFGLVVCLLESGCATMGTTNNSLVPTKFETRTGPYIVYTHTPLADNAPAIRHLQSLERQVQATLGVRLEPGEQPIEIYILGDQQAFDHFLKIYYPELPSRRAFFLAQGSRQVVYTYFNPQLEIDLRHEATHALIHLGFVDLPLWLDEGLAEYFEVSEERQGLNLEHIGKLPTDLSSGWTPNLPRLERIKDVRQMSPRDYRESWAWVHYLLHGSAPGKAALLGYLADLRKAKEPPQPLSVRLESKTDGGAATSLVEYLGRFGDLVARVQDSSVVPSSLKPSSPATPVVRDSQRSAFGRLMERLRN